MKNAAENPREEGNNMKVKLMFTSVLETLHGLGLSGWVSYLLSKIALAGSLEVGTLDVIHKGRRRMR